MNLSMTPRLVSILLAAVISMPVLVGAHAQTALPVTAAPAVPVSEPARAPGAVSTAELADVAAAHAGLRILDAADATLEEFLWQWRIVAVLADTPNDPAFIQQMREIEARAGDLLDRDVVVIVDSNRGSNSGLRQRLRARGFMLAIIDKDGEIKQRRPAPRDVREISAIIDRFPLRRQEMLERRPAGR